MRPRYVSDQIGKLSKHLLGRRVSAHKLRYTFAIRMVKLHPADLQAISQYLGHSNVSIKNTFYVHTSLSPAKILGDLMLGGRVAQ